MASVNEYRQIVRDVLQPFTEADYENVQATNRLVCDQQNDQYLVLSIGWAKRPKRRIHGCLVHIEIIDGKIWIQRDGTEDGIAEDLERMGVPRDDIVLGFREPHLRQYTDYAAA